MFRFLTQNSLQASPEDALKNLLSNGHQEILALELNSLA
jgi:hypothetical protein